MQLIVLSLSLLAAGAAAAAADSCKDGKCPARTVATLAPMLLQFRSDMTSAGGLLGRFCGIASNTEQGNDFSSTDLGNAANAAGPTRVWHYNWKMHADFTSPDVMFVPTIKFPGETHGMPVGDLPQANSNGVGNVVKGWNEPDDAGQAGKDHGLRSTPEAYSKAWVEDMMVARSKGFTEFVSPAMAHDTNWLDFFLKSCMHAPSCPQFVTYLGFHRYRTDCATYSADADTSKNAGFRDDLSYVLTYYRMMQKYNAKGFNIKGLVWDEMGCLINGAPSPDEQQLRYMQQWFSNTIVKVKNGDAATIEKIRDTPWIMPRGPDALEAGVSYSLNMGHAMDVGSKAGDDAVKAIQSIVTVAWFSITPEANHLFVPHQGLSNLGVEWFNTCKTVRSGAAPAPPTSAPALPPTPAPTPTLVLPPSLPTPTPAPPPPPSKAVPGTGSDLLDSATMRITNAASHRTLYAAVGKNGGEGVGAAAHAGADGVWKLLSQPGGGYKIVNEASGRALYAQSGSNWGDGLGAESPSSSIGSDGVWNLVHKGGNKYRIENTVNGRTLYAQSGSEMAAGVGAGAPATAVNDDGEWILTPK